MLEGPEGAGHAANSFVTGCDSATSHAAPHAAGCQPHLLLARSAAGDPDSAVRGSQPGSAAAPHEGRRSLGRWGAQTAPSAPSPEGDSLRGTRAGAVTALEQPVGLLRTRPAAPQGRRQSGQLGSRPLPQLPLDAGPDPAVGQLTRGAVPALTLLPAAVGEQPADPRREEGHHQGFVH